MVLLSCVSPVYPNLFLSRLTICSRGGRGFGQIQIKCKVVGIFGDKLLIMHFLHKLNMLNPKKLFIKLDSAI